MAVLLGFVFLDLCCLVGGTSDCCCGLFFLLGGFGRVLEGVLLFFGGVWVFLF